MSNVLPPEPDPELESFFDDVVGGMELDMNTEGATPDLAAVVALAHQMDANRVPAEAVDEVATYAPVVNLNQGRRFRQTRDDLELDALCQQVRAHMDQEVARELSQPQQPQKAAPRTPRHLWIAIAVAAALVIGIGIGTLQATRFLQDSSSTDQSAALHSGREDESDTRAVELGEPEAPRERPKAAVEPEPELEESAPPPEEEVLEEAPLDNERTSQRRKRKRNDRVKEAPEPPVETVQDKLARLDREAQAAWRSKQLAKAEKLFMEIVRLDKGGRYAGHAYGDLFIIARQRGDKGGQVKLWKAYLKRFPKGRFADDARAGLCRQMSGGAKIACWRAYLDDMPKGSYRGQAKRAIEDAGGP